MISHKHKFIFISPPKTGSTSLMRSLVPYANIKKIIEQPQWNTFDFCEFDEDFNKSEWLIFSQKNNYKEYTSGVAFDPRKHSNLQSYNKSYIKDYKIYCVIRNPFSRAISMWKWEKSVKGIFEGVDYRKLNFDQFLYNHTKDWYCKPQYEFIYTDSIDMNCINLIRFENLQEDFNIVCEKIGIPQQTLPHKNKSNHKHYTEYYNDKTREIVAQRYARDIEYFGYEFGE